MKYNDGKLIEEEQLIADDQVASQRNKAIHFHMNQSEKLEYSSLVVKVVYSNGKEFEKEVYSK